MPRQVSTNNKQTKNQMENKMIKKNSSPQTESKTQNHESS